VKTNRTLIVAGKELTEIFKDKRSVGISIFFALFFSIMYSMKFLDVENLMDFSMIDTSVFFLTTAVGFFVVYMSTSQIFLREKMDRVIETVMCTPLTLREIWLGKVLAVTTFSYLLSIFTALVVVVASSLFSGSLLIPVIEVFFHVFITVPVFAAAIAGLMGLMQLYLGLRENRILNFIIFVPVFGALYGVGYAVGGEMTVNWLFTGIVFLASVFLLGIATYFVRRLRKERIITTLS
jgi:ABC-2 type transport system permease protein